MGNMFLKLVNMSLTASWMALAILFLRWLWRKAPKRMICVLWGLVALRLICPFSVESVCSLIPDSEPIEHITLLSEKGEDTRLPLARVPAGYEDILQTDNAVQTVQIESVVNLCALIWLIGASGMLLYMVIRYVGLKRRVATATILHENIWQSERVSSPFVFGFLRPRIYLPYSIQNADMSYVIAHEKAHIRSLDHIWKLFGFAILSVHWFNPVLWVAYICFCRDTEAACDEKVIAGMSIEERRAYSTALLHCAVRQRRMTVSPLAFGEIGVKERVTNVMNYRKPALGIVALAVVVCLVIAVCFLTNPKEVQKEKNAEQLETMTQQVLDETEELHGKETISDGRVVSIHQTLEAASGGQIIIDASVEPFALDEVSMYTYKALDVSDSTREKLFDIYFVDKADEVYRKSDVQDIWQLGETVTGNFYKYESLPTMDGTGETVFYLEYRKPNLNPRDENFLGGVKDSICTITAESALSLCDKLMLAFADYGEYEVDYIHAYGAYVSPELYFEEAPPEPFYWITYKRQLDGMPVTDYNDLYFFVNDDGVQKIHGSLYEAEPMDTNTALLSVTDAVERLQKNKDSLDPGDHNTILIGNICPEYLVVEQDGVHVIAPVWRFEIGGTEEERILNRNRILAVHAFTGEVIWDCSSYGGY